MRLQDNSPALSKIKRSADKTDIHNLFIFNKAGICLFGRNFTNSYEMEDNLISSFFTALMSFTKEIIGNKIKTVEMAGVKFVIIEKGMFYYGLLCNSIEHLTLLEEIILKINTQFLDYLRKNKIKGETEYIYDEDLDKKVDSIIKETLSNEFDLRKERKIIKYLDNLALNDDLEGIILLTDKGNVIYSTLKKIYLRNFLKEVDFRVKIWNNSILKLYYTSKNKELIFSEYVEDLYVIILMFDFKTKFGVAEYYLHKAVKFIRKIINH